uniref:Period circadian protein n=1 Tax=Timema poppense TaxID=170557 RepID=A0A7R9H0I2_TIMPO|nr:unnamed protein product [Timema poppensis]
MEETDTSTTTKVSDSAYSNSCNSKSQRSSESFKSRLSNSSGSSGYGDNPSTLSSHNGVTPQDPEIKRIKKKKKHKGGGCNESEQETIISSEYSCSSHKVLGTSREGPNCPDSDHHPGHRTGVAPSSDIHKTDQLPSVDPASVEKTPQNQVTRQVQELLTPSQCPPSNTYSCVETHVRKFSAGVSMQQGTVIYTTGPLTDILGFPEDMWVGRSFIDFVHPKDRTVLTTFITARVANIITSSFDSEIVPNKDLIFCSLRRYRGLHSSGFGVTEKKVTYLPFQLTLNFIGPAPGKEDFILLVTATQVTSIYKCPDEIHTSSKFVTHQLADMSLSHVDPEVVTHMGYFPQDMLNHSIFDFYHPEDLPFFKEVYQTIMKKKGPPFRSKPYRFRVHNGSFVLIETEWSSFVNPWSKKLELIVGQHSILKGPTNPDVFAARPESKSPQISEELLKQSKVIQDEIICLLTEMVVDSVLSPKLQVSKRCKDMATFMESLMGEVSKIDLKVEEQNISEKGSVTLGGISLHNANCDNTTSTDTPPSYNQLNYNDNIQRFFESRPKTTPSVGSRELKTEMNKPLMIPINASKCSASGDSTLASSNNRKCCAPLNNTSGGSNSRDRAAIIHNGTNTSHVSYKPAHLTEAILWRHNEHMEKKMVQKHQEQLSKGDHRETESKKCQQLQTNNNNQDAGVHGVKRSGSHSWEGKPFKGSKHPHVDGIPEEPSPTTNMPPPLSHWPTAKMTPLHQGPSNINLLPPFSVTMTPLHPTIPSTTNSYSTPPPIYPQMTNMIPLYYFPSGVERQENPETPPISVRQPSPNFMTPPVSYMNMPGIMYPGMMQPIYQGSLMYQPNMVMLHPAPVVPAVKTHVSSPAALFHYPIFLATPPIAEPRSNFGNIAPASINKSVLEKEGDKEWNLSQEEGDKKYSLCTGNETSYSSFYSFLKTTDKSDESMEENSKSEDMAWDKTDARGGKKARPVLRDPPWMEGVFVNPDLVYRYKLDERIMADILQADLKALNKTHQPLLVNNQLTQLYEDMEEEGLSKDCLEESLPSSSSSGEDSNNHPFTQPSSGKVKKKRRNLEYSKLVMIFEENAPLPPPSSQ